MSHANKMAVEYVKGLLGHARKANTKKLRAPKHEAMPAQVEGSPEEEAGGSDLEALLEGDEEMEPKKRR